MKVNKRIPLIVSLLVLTLLGFGYYLNQMLIPEVKKNQQILDNNRQALQIRKNEYQQVLALDERFSDIQEEAKTALIALPSEAQLVDIPYQMAAIADDNSLQSFNWSISTVPVTMPRSSLQALGLNLSFVGDYGQIISYLEDLNQSLRLINVTNVTISGGASLDAGDSPLSVSLQANAYFNSI